MEAETAHAPEQAAQREAAGRDRRGARRCTGLGEATGEQAGAGIAIGGFLPDAVKIERRLGFAREVDQLWRFRLHAEGEFILGHARDGLGIAVALLSEAVELAERVEHLAARGAVDAGGHGAVAASSAGK